MSYFKPAITISLIAISMMMMMMAAAQISSTTINGYYNTAYAAVSSASSNPLTAKEEFDITVTNIMHRNIIVAVTIDGLTKAQLIPGNNKVIAYPTSKVVIFRFDRHSDATAPTALPIKLGDEWDTCIKFDNNTKTSCLRATIDSVTQPQKKTLDSRYIPSHNLDRMPNDIAQFPLPLAS